MKLSDLPARARKRLQNMPKNIPPQVAAGTALTQKHHEKVVRFFRKRSKYGAVRTAVGGITFDSAKEAGRYQELLWMARARKIWSLRAQVPFDLTVNGVLVCRYVADFVYLCCRPDGSPGHQVVEDVKSPATRRNRAYRIKVKLMAACHGITIKEV